MSSCNARSSSRAVGAWSTLKPCTLVADELRPHALNCVHRPLRTNIRGRTPYCGRYNSKLERSALVHWLARHDVESAELNTLHTTYHDDSGRVRRYLADIAVAWKRGVERRPLIVECKYQRDLDADPALKRKHACIEEAVSARGYEFRVMTEVDVFTPEFIAKEFIVGHRYDPPSPYEEEVMALVQNAGCITLGRALGSLRKSETECLRLVPIFWRLVAVGKLFVRYSAQPLGDETYLHATPIPLPEP